MWPWVEEAQAYALQIVPLGVTFQPSSLDFSSTGSRNCYSRTTRYITTYAEAISGVLDDEMEVN
jgi:hypothetical protein